MFTHDDDELFSEFCRQMPKDLSDPFIGCYTPEEFESQFAKDFFIDADRQYFVRVCSDAENCHRWQNYETIYKDEKVAVEYVLRRGVRFAVQVLISPDYPNKAETETILEAAGLERSWQGEKEGWDCWVRVL